MAGKIDGIAWCALLFAAVMVSAGCHGSTGAPAPVDFGVCWRADFQPHGRPVFTPVAGRAPDLLSCAADLDLAYLSEGAPVTGAFQGRYIFIGPAAIESAERLDMIHYPIFNVAQRASLDRQLRGLLAAQSKGRRPQG
jgi:hypothetical protein